MKALTFFMLCTLFLSSAAYATTEPPSDPAVQAALQDFKRAYSAELVIGDALEVNGLKIIPLATAGLGVAPRGMHGNTDGLPGVGGLMMPVGVIVVSDQDVRIIQVSKGFVEQFAGALAPVALQFLQARWGKGDAALSAPQPISTPAAPPDRNFSASYVKGAVVLWIVWAILAFLLQKLFPDKIAAIAAGYHYHAIEISLLGLVGLGILCLLSIIFTLSLIGIPLTFALFLLGGAFTLFGSIGLALFLGQQSATAFKYHYSEARLMLIGGGLFGVLGMIPVLGILSWAVVAVFGFGAILQNQREHMHRHRTL